VLCGSLQSLSVVVSCLVRHIFKRRETDSRRGTASRHSSIRAEFRRPYVRTRETTLEFAERFFFVKFYFGELHQIFRTTSIFYLPRTTVPDAFRHGQFTRRTLHVTGTPHG
jgi:hypothetical protein